MGCIANNRRPWRRRPLVGLLIRLLLRKLRKIHLPRWGRFFFHFVSTIPTEQGANISHNNMDCLCFAAGDKTVGAIHESPEILKIYQYEFVYALYNSVAINLCKHNSRRRAMRHKGGESPLRHTNFIFQLFLQIKAFSRRFG